MLDKLLDVLIGWPAVVAISLAVWFGARLWKRHGT